MDASRNCYLPHNVVHSGKHQVEACDYDRFPYPQLVPVEKITNFSATTWHIQMAEDNKMMTKDACRDHH